MQELQKIRFQEIDEAHRILSAKFTTMIYFLRQWLRRMRLHFHRRRAL